MNPNQSDGYMPSGFYSLVNYVKLPTALQSKQHAPAWLWGDVVGVAAVLARKGLNLRGMGLPP